MKVESQPFWHKLQILYTRPFVFLEWEIIISRGGGDALNTTCMASHGCTEHVFIESLAYNLHILYGFSPGG